MAAFLGHENIVRLLLESGADLHAKGYFPYSNKIRIGYSLGGEQSTYVSLQGRKSAYWQIETVPLGGASFEGHSVIAILLLSQDVHAFIERGTLSQAIEDSFQMGHLDLAFKLVCMGIDNGLGMEGCVTQLSAAGPQADLDLLEFVLERRYCGNIRNDLIDLLLQTIGTRAAGLLPTAYESCNARTIEFLLIADASVEHPAKRLKRSPVPTTQNQHCIRYAYKPDAGNKGKLSLQDACSMGYRGVAADLISHGAHINPTDNRTISPLCAAIQGYLNNTYESPAFLNTVNFLLESGANTRCLYLSPSLFGQSLYSLLYNICSKGCLDLLKLLEAKDPNLMPKHGTIEYLEMLRSAVKHSQVDMARHLINSGPATEKVIEVVQCCLLNDAQGQISPHSLRVILDMGIPLGKLLGSGDHNPLIKACCLDYSSTVHFFLEQLAEILEPSILRIALENSRSMAVVIDLLTYKRDHTTETNGYNKMDIQHVLGVALLKSVSTRLDYKFAAFLLSAGADANITDNAGHTVLDHVAMSKNTMAIELLRLLLCYKAKTKAWSEKHAE